MNKKERQLEILKLIAESEIDTQEELARVLNENNFNVTQATVSRDIKELNLIKVSGKSKKYKYAVMQHNEQRDIYKMFNLFKVSVISVTTAQNIVVVKTLPGMANAIGVCIDSLQEDCIVGSVAGDDTMLIVVKSSELAKTLEAELKGIFSLK